MDEYIKLAEQLETLAAGKEVTLDKVAAAAVLYESLSGQENTASVECLAKIAHDTVVEADVALELGVEIGINALLNMEA